MNQMHNPPFGKDANECLLFGECGLHSEINCLQTCFLHHCSWNTASLTLNNNQSIWIIILLYLVHDVDNPDSDSNTSDDDDHDGADDEDEDDDDVDEDDDEEDDDDDEVCSFYKMEGGGWHFPEKIKNLQMQNVIEFTDDFKLLGKNTKPISMYPASLEYTKGVDDLKTCKNKAVDVQSNLYL